MGETGDGDEALDIAERVDPHLVILGLNLVGEPDGIEVCWRLKALPKPPRVLVHTARDFAAGVSPRLLAGADGYLHKSVCCEEFLTAIRRVADWERAWGVGGGRLPRSTEGVERDGRLTPKEREVLMLRSFSNTEMVEKLFLSLPTVRTHVRNILRKLGAKNRRDSSGPASSTRNASPQDHPRGMMPAAGYALYSVFATLQGAESWWRTIAR